MHSATTATIVAIAGCAAAVAAVAAAWWAHVRLGHVRDAQRSLLGGNRRDIVDFAVSLQGRIDGLHRAVDELGARFGRLERRLDSTVSRVAVVRYDAYENTGGHQSASVALLDSSRSGLVLSAIQGRDYARIYIKELDDGRAAVSLSPEEQQAVERAMKST